MDLMTVTRRRGLEFNIHVRGHDVSTDMSVQDGGEDASFSPSELLAGSLGACIAMMVQGYCDRHGYTDGDVGVSLALEYADDPKRVGAIVVDVELPGDVPEDQWDVVRRIAERCTIHETFHHPPRVDIEFM
jgi:uncharacterized OsmC-like protein